ncbi:MAG: hypothetical protein ACFFFK_05960 [Candidatus Thorarchaeota archaeon]
MKKSVLVDKRCLQTFAHFEEFYFNAFGQQRVPNPAYMNRLSRFFEILEAHKLEIGNITRERLDEVSCLVILSRIRDFTDEELKAILEFIQHEDNSLLLMSNHNPFELQDNVLTSKLGISLIGGYWSGERGVYTHIEGECLTNHAIITGKEGEQPVKTIVTNTTCRIESDIGTPIIFLPDSMIGRWSSENEPEMKNRIFGLVVDGKREEHDIIKGKVIVLADSGFIGDKDSTFPGFGVIDQSDNELLVKRMFEFLMS